MVMFLWAKVVVGEDITLSLRELDNETLDHPGESGRGSNTLLSFIQPSSFLSWSYLTFMVDQVSMFLTIHSGPLLLAELNKEGGKTA